MALKPIKIFKDIVVARTGVQKYFESDLKEDGDPLKIVEVHRGEREVKALVKEVLFTPIVIHHPDSKVVIYNDNKDIIGYVNDAYYRDGLIYTELYMFKEPPFKEFSLGYDAEVKEEDGVFFFSNMRVNHLANVEFSRCGIMCSINKNKGKQMANITIADKSIEVDDTVAGYITALQAENKKLKVDVNDSFGRGVEEAKKLGRIQEIAKREKIDIADNDNVKTLSIKIVDSYGIKTDGKSEEYINGIIEGREAVKSINDGQQSVTSKKDEFDYSTLEIKGL